jgi:hypothetical protein
VIEIARASLRVHGVAAEADLAGNGQSEKGRKRKDAYVRGGVDTPSRSKATETLGG